jgi:hypothetical protein
MISEQDEKKLLMNPSSNNVITGVSSYQLFVSKRYNKTIHLLGESPSLPKQYPEKSTPVEKHIRKLFQTSREFFDVFVEYNHYKQNGRNITYSKYNRTIHNVLLNILDLFQEKSSKRAGRLHTVDISDRLPLVKQNPFTREVELDDDYNFYRNEPLRRDNVLQLCHKTKVLRQLRMSTDLDIEMLITDELFQDIENLRSFESGLQSLDEKVFYESASKLQTRLVQVFTKAYLLGRMFRRFNDPLFPETSRILALVSEETSQQVGDFLSRIGFRTIKSIQSPDKVIHLGGSDIGARELKSFPFVGGKRRRAVLQNVLTVLEAEIYAKGKTELPKLIETQPAKSTREFDKWVESRTNLKRVKEDLMVTRFLNNLSNTVTFHPESKNKVEEWVRILYSPLDAGKLAEAFKPAKQVEDEKELVEEEKKVKLFGWLMGGYSNRGEVFTVEFTNVYNQYWVGRANELLQKQVNVLLDLFDGKHEEHQSDLFVILVLGHVKETKKRELIENALRRILFYLAVTGSA